MYNTQQNNSLTSDEHNNQSEQLPRSSLHPTQSLPTTAATTAHLTLQPLSPDIYNMLSTEFDAESALSKPSNVNVPIKSAKVYFSLSETSSLLPFTDSHFKGPKFSTSMIGASKHRLSVEFAQQEDKLLQSLHQQHPSNSSSSLTSATSDPLDPTLNVQNMKNKSKHFHDTFHSNKKNQHQQQQQQLQQVGQSQCIYDQLLLLRKMKEKVKSISSSQSINIVPRFTTAVKVSKMTLSSYPLLMFKGSSNPWYNRMRKTQLIRFFCLLSSQCQLHYSHQQQQQQSQQYRSSRIQFNRTSLPNNLYIDHYITQKLIDVLSHSVSGSSWILYFLLREPYIFSASITLEQQQLQQSTPNTNKTTSVIQKMQLIHPRDQTCLDNHIGNTNNNTNDNNNGNSSNFNTDNTDNTDNTHNANNNNPILSSSSPLSPPLKFRNMILRYPYLTPKQLLYMLLSTHFHHQCKVHETKRKRLNYPCTCLHRLPFSAPAQLKSHPSHNTQLSYQPQHQYQENPERRAHIDNINNSNEFKPASTSAIPVTTNSDYSLHIATLSPLETSLTHVTNPKIRHLVKKATFVKTFHQPGPLALLSTFLSSAHSSHLSSTATAITTSTASTTSKTTATTPKSIRVTTLGHVPAFPYPLCLHRDIFTQTQHQHLQPSHLQNNISQINFYDIPQYPLNLSRIDLIKHYTHSIPLLSASTILPLLHSIDEISQHDHWWSHYYTSSSVASSTMMNVYSNMSNNNSLNIAHLDQTNQHNYPTHFNNNEDKFIFNMFYNRSGNSPFFPQYDSPFRDSNDFHSISARSADTSIALLADQNETNELTPHLSPNNSCTHTPSLLTLPQPTTFHKGRLKQGVGSILYGYLQFYDRHGNIGLNEVTEYKWVWIPLPASSSSLSYPNDQSHQYKEHGIWTILARKLPRIILTASTIITVSQNQQHPNML